LNHHRRTIFTGSPGARAGCWYHSSGNTT
jgi:hypothetical protein